MSIKILVIIPDQQEDSDSEETTPVAFDEAFDAIDMGLDAHLFEDYSIEEIKECKPLQESNI